MSRNTYKQKKSTVKYVVGIDEAGRGPLAGPVAVGAFCVEIKRIENKKIEDRKLKKIFVGARDSKKMSAKKREEIFAKIIAVQKKKSIQYMVMMESAKIIDTKGISWAIRNCIRKCLKKLNVNSAETSVLLDGSLKAPAEFMNQKTIIKGDDKELVISLASICAKVTRDAYMKKMAKKYPQYGLEIHKGYGTERHRKSIQKYGLSTVHRKSFCKKYV